MCGFSIVSLCGGDTGPLWMAARPRRAAGSQATHVTVDVPQCGAPAWPIHLDGGVKYSLCGDILSHEASSHFVDSHNQES